MGMMQLGRMAMWVNCLPATTVMVMKDSWHRWQQGEVNPPGRWRMEADIEDEGDDEGEGTIADNNDNRKHGDEDDDDEDEDG